MEEAENMHKEVPTQVHQQEAPDFHPVSASEDNEAHVIRVTSEPVKLRHVLRMKNARKRYVAQDALGAYEELMVHYDSIRCRVGAFTAVHTLIVNALLENPDENTGDRIAAMEEKREIAARMARYTLPWVQQ